MIVNRYAGLDNKELKLGADSFIGVFLWKLISCGEILIGKEKSAQMKAKILEAEEYCKFRNNTEKCLKEIYDKKKLPLFSSVEIEVINRCNGECPFCPVNKYDDIRKMKKMDEQLFKSIINQLGALGYSGRLALHSNNEPFLDSRIIDFAKYAREHVPNAHLYMYTNGTLLTIDKFERIIPYLDQMIIDNYDDNLRLHENAKAIHNLCRKNMGLDKKVTILLRKVHEVLKTRGGQAPNNKKRRVYNMSCILPYKQMVVRPDGKLSFCCNDAYGKYTMADLNKMTLMEAWYSPHYVEAREKLRKGRKNIKICRYCDTTPDPYFY